MLKIDWATLLAMMTALLIAGVSVYRERQRPTALSREKHLEVQLTALENTIQTILRDRTAAQMQIDVLRRELDEAKLRIAQLQAELAQYTRPAATAGLLLAAIGADPALQVDLAALRRVVQRTGMRLTRLSPATMSNLERTLDRHRKIGEPIKWLHLAMHAGPEGVVFLDGLATGQWLSEHLSGVELMVINGCQGDQIADWAGVVPAVVSMREEINHADAAIFAEVFWMAIGESLNAEDAFDRAVQRCPPVVAEFAELHL